MALFVKSFSNLYKDSVSLMQISAKLSKMPGIRQASVAMATPANLERMQDVGMHVDVEAKPNDLLVAVIADSEEVANQAFAMATEMLSTKKATAQKESSINKVLTSISMGVETHPEANLALISVPGSYAAAEALKALSMGLHVMMFSDNVSEKDELSIKQYATAHDLIVMGPDCGTAIINGSPLGFANVIAKGNIGVVAASGTGLQEVTCRIDALGGGISQAIGTGGRDLHEGIGGLSMIQGIKMLGADDQTRVITLVSKPPHSSVAEKVLDAACKTGKAVVVHFLGADQALFKRPGVTVAQNLAQAAEFSVALSKGEVPSLSESIDETLVALVREQYQKLHVSQKDIRGVFAGGTFCYEAQLALKAAGLECESNAPIKGGKKLVCNAHGTGNSLIDMGDDEFTQGRPHPMIDPTLRNERLKTEALDNHTAVVLFDVVLGYGAHLNPAQGLVEEINSIRLRLQSEGREVLFIAHVCGTQADIQSRQEQIQILKNAGVIVADSNIQAARLAIMAANRA